MYIIIQPNGNKKATQVATDYSEKLYKLSPQWPGSVTTSVFGVFTHPTENLAALQCDSTQHLALADNPALNDIFDTVDGYTTQEKTDIRQNLAGKKGCTFGELKPAIWIESDEQYMKDNNWFD